ncbi:MAG: FadR family transcriptional regulator [Porphyromonadaceae bacterium]|nr:FadR family transcriptional regulator [Porphyromonadaceae bacterium]
MAMEIPVNQFEKINITSPSDLIIEQIKNQISSGQLKQGDKLPPERQLSETFGVSRAYVRESIRKLEFCGVLKTYPQNGTYVTNLGIDAIEGLITNVLKVGSRDFYSLVETRLIIEVNSARLCAIRRSDMNLNEIEVAVANFENEVNQNNDPYEADLAFHTAIVKGSNNSVLKSLLEIIIPDIISSYTEYRMCSSSRELDKTVKEHRALLEAIRRQDPNEAAELMNKHLENVMEFARGQL